MTPDLNWQKSSFSSQEGSECIEVAMTGDLVHIRESDNGEVVITTTPAKLAAFLMGVKAGEFDHFTTTEV